MRCQIVCWQHHTISAKNFSKNQKKKSWYFPQLQDTKHGVLTVWCSNLLPIFISHPQFIDQKKHFTTHVHICCPGWAQLWRWGSQLNQKDRANYVTTWWLFYYHKELAFCALETNFFLDFDRYLVRYPTYPTRQVKLLSEPPLTPSYLAPFKASCIRSGEIHQHSWQSWQKWKQQFCFGNSLT